MIETLLPPEVSAVERRGDDDDAAPLPEEHGLVEGAVAARRAEFATARACARLALQRIGVPPGPILRGPKREPLWPPGVVGSITHCTGYRAAAVARADQVLTVGIDAEPDAPIEARIATRVMDAGERAWIAGAPAGIHWDRLIFSAKESVYKAWFPLTRRWLGFEEAHVAIDPEAGIFEARLLIEPPTGVPAAFHGRYIAANGLVITAIAVLRRGAQA
jgi:enterobactin synthetase component D / holo-[acyl-carrier protein] synthase